MMVVCYEAHVVCIDNSERSKTISNDSEKSDKNVVDDVDDIVFLTSDVDPT